MLELWIGFCATNKWIAAHTRMWICAVHEWRSDIRWTAFSRVILQKWHRNVKSWTVERREQCNDIGQKYSNKHVHTRKFELQASYKGRTLAFTWSWVLHERLECSFRDGGLRAMRPLTHYTLSAPLHPLLVAQCALWAGRCALRVARAGLLKP